MNCYVCTKQSRVTPGSGDFANVECDECGHYRISRTVIHLLDKGRWLHTVAMQQWLEEQRQNGETRPLITSSVVVWDGVWVQG